MRYIFDPPKSPMEQKAKHPLVSPFLRGTEGGSKRGTLIYCTLLQRFALYLFLCDVSSDVGAGLDA